MYNFRLTYTRLFDFRRTKLTRYYLLSGTLQACTTRMSLNSPSFGSPAGGPGASGGQMDPEMQAFIETEASKAKIQQQIHKLNNLCWDTCVDKPRDKMDSRTESCLCNCVERFVDVAKLIEQRFQQRVQKAASGGY